MSYIRRSHEMREALIAHYVIDDPRGVRAAELARLPFRAAMAVAARCVRRLRPLMRAVQSAKARELALLSVERAVTSADDLAAGEGLDLSLADQLAHGTEMAIKGVFYAGRGVAYGAMQMLRSMAAAFAEGQQAAMEELSVAVWFSIAEAPVAAGGERAERERLPGWLVMSPDPTRDAVQKDYRAAAALRVDVPWEVGPPIDPSEAGPLGPLWPDGTPAWARERLDGQT